MKVYTFIGIKIYVIHLNYTIFIRNITKIESVLYKI